MIKGLSLDSHLCIFHIEMVECIPVLNTFLYIGIMWVKQCHLHHPPAITIFIGGMVPIPSHGWFMIYYWFTQITLNGIGLNFGYPWPQRSFEPPVP